MSFILYSNRPCKCVDGQFIRHYLPCQKQCRVLDMGMTLWLISMVLFVASSLMGGINYVSTVLNMRTKGMDLWKMPLTIWAFFLTAILGVLSFPVLVAGVVLLIFDRSFGTSFYLSDIVYAVHKYYLMKVVAQSCSSTYSGSWVTLKYIS